MVLSVDPQETITIAEAGRRAGVVPNTVRQWIAAGKVKSVPTPLGRLVVTGSLEEYVRIRQREGEGGGQD